MIIEFIIKNYRSLKDETVLSLEASGAKGKSDNIAEVKTKNGKKFRLLKTAVIYGPNASGKSNIIRAYWAFRQMVATSFRNDVNEDLNTAEPFELDSSSSKEPTEFTLNFIARDQQQYIYYISFSKSEGILEEYLKYYPEKSTKLIFRRRGRKLVSSNDAIFKSKNIPDALNPKRLFLSELGNSGDIYWENLRNDIVLGTSALNTSINGMQPYFMFNAKRIFERTDKESLAIKESVTRLIQFSDLGIKGLDLVEEEILLKENNNVNDFDIVYKESKKEKRFKTYHDIFLNNQVIDTKTFDLLNQGSAGTFALLGLSTEIIQALHSTLGKTIWADEIDNSLHPLMCRFLIGLFNHPVSNPNNAQLIFATHESTLLDKNTFRKDQIWITSKDKYGVTKLYSVHDLDIEGLRDDIPFDKWYLSGKFGGLPKINDMDFIYKRNELTAYGQTKK
jgi:AAA15 family ATPase/GTPase